MQNYQNNMQTFKDVIGKSYDPDVDPDYLPTFKQMTEGHGVPCLSEKMIAKMESVFKAMCTEMKAIHEDNTKRTCESYCAEAESRLFEMASNLKKQSESYLAALH
jgi:hypothetical protein